MPEIAFPEMAQGLTQAYRTKGQDAVTSLLGRQKLYRAVLAADEICWLMWGLPAASSGCSQALLLLLCSALEALGWGKRSRGWPVNRNILIASNSRKKSQALIQLPWKRATWIPVQTDFPHLGKCIRLVFFRVGYWSWQYIGEQLNSLTVASEGDQLRSCR